MLQIRLNIKRSKKYYDKFRSEKPPVHACTVHILYIYLLNRPPSP